MSFLVSFLKALGWLIFCTFIVALLSLPMTSILLTMDSPNDTHTIRGGTVERMTRTYKRFKSNLTDNFEKAKRTVAASFASLFTLVIWQLVLSSIIPPVNKKLESLGGFTVLTLVPLMSFLEMFTIIGLLKLLCVPGFLVDLLLLLWNTHPDRGVSQTNSQAIT